MKFAVLVETTRGFFRLEEIAKCHPRIVSLSLGSEDFAADAGLVRVVDDGAAIRRRTKGNAALAIAKAEPAFEFRKRAVEA